MSGRFSHVPPSHPPPPIPPPSRPSPALFHSPRVSLVRLPQRKHNISSSCPFHPSQSPSFRPFLGQSLLRPSTSPPGSCLISSSQARKRLSTKAVQRTSIPYFPSDSLEREKTVPKKIPPTTRAIHSDLPVDLSGNRTIFSTQQPSTNSDSLFRSLAPLGFTWNRVSSTDNTRTSHSFIHLNLACSAQITAATKVSPRKDRIPHVLPLQQQPASHQIGRLVASARNHSITRLVAPGQTSLLFQTL